MEGGGRTFLLNARVYEQVQKQLLVTTKKTNINRKKMSNAQDVGIIKYLTPIRLRRLNTVTYFYRQKLNQTVADLVQLKQYEHYSANLHTVLTPFKAAFLHFTDSNRIVLNSSELEDHL
jgi:hypothetical protein